MRTWRRGYALILVCTWHVLALMLWVQGCGGGVYLEVASAPVYGPWFDGTYTGRNDLPTPQLVRVDVEVTRGSIVAIRMREHPAWRAPQEQELLIQRVIELQTTDIESPRAPGSDADRLLRAIEDGLKRAWVSQTDLP